MGVNSLWKVLDEAGCGKPVGVQEMSNPNGSSKPTALQAVNPWNVHRQKTRKETPTKKVVLAVDLSIWICEALSSPAIADNHAQPAIHLVFTRTVKLLSMGIGLVFVIEGKRRVRDAGITRNDEADKFRKRRNGTAFWKACKNCHDMLKLMGVAVVRATAEGEALCALLNQKGVVDGVISNDGDCLLFGAKVVFTKFSIDNLENNRVIRYDTDQLAAVIKVGDDKDLTTKEVGRLNLGRQDLISFALLTGSDLAGSGLEKVGYKKAIRFIRKCQLDNPLRIETAAIEELKSWASSIAPCDYDPFDQQPVLPPKVPGPCCSRCNHPGFKRNHLKNGCETCGTEPGEPCFECTTEDRFRQSLRAKALALFPKFDPSQVVEAYIHPNDGILPVQFTAGKPPCMSTPDFLALMKMKLVVKGRSQEGSREYIKTAIGRLLSRAELLEPEAEEATDEKQENRDPSRRADCKPVPLEITRTSTVAGIPSYHVVWRIGGTAVDREAKQGGGHGYSTVEPQGLVKKRFPKLVEKFLEAEKERTKQGDGEKIRRREFLASLWVNVNDQPEGEYEGDGDPEPSPVKKRNKKRKTFFKDSKRAPIPRKQIRGDCGDDVHKLLRCVGGQRPFEGAGDSSIETIAGDLSVSQENYESYTSPEKKQGRREIDLPPTPLYCHFGEYLIPVSPIEAMVPGEFPPRHIYIHRNHSSER